MSAAASGQDTVDPFVIKLMVREVCRQSQYALLAYNALVDSMNAIGSGQRVPTEQVFLFANSTLTHIANISKILRPDQNRGNAAARAARIARGGALSTILAVAESSPIHDRDLRNDLEHLDERLDEWVRSTDFGASRIVLDQNICPDGWINLAGPQELRRINPETLDYTFTGHRAALSAMAKETAAIATRAAEWLTAQGEYV